MTPARQGTKTVVVTPASDVVETAAQAIAAAHPIVRAPAQPDLNLMSITILGELLDDLEHVRVATDNRIRALEQEIGLELPAMTLLSGHLAAAEHQAQLELKRIWRKHPLALWAASVHGLGEKSIARLIAVIGNPADRPNPAKLWQYCGHGDPERLRPPKGATQAEVLACGKPRAKKQVWLIATAFMKDRQSPYRALYEQRRIATTDREWTDGHSHADALRVVGKAFLKDLWIAARQSTHEIQGINAGAQRRNETQRPNGAQPSYETHARNGAARKVAA